MNILKILVLNAGSSSLKFKLYDMSADARVVAEGNCQRVGLPSGEIKYVGPGGEKKVFEMPLPTYDEALSQTIQLLTKGEGKVLDSVRDIDAIGHRIAMGGPHYRNSVRIDDAVINAVEALQDVTPLHTPPQIHTIRACRKLLGEDFPMAAGFDTAFHQTIPPEGYLYPIPYEYYEKHAVRKFGFHGLSHHFVVERYGQLRDGGLAGTRVVTCHMGGGSSVTAVLNGESQENSFGFGTGESLVCGTRCGIFDHAAIGYLMEKEDISFERVEEILHKESGLLGLSGISSDEKELEELAMQGNKRAKLAVDILMRQVKKYIGSYAFLMGGLDAIVFTGGIGENSDYCRAGICRGLEEFGVLLDEDANRAFNRSEHRISKPESKVDIWIIPTNEELVIARDTASIISGNL